MSSVLATTINVESLAKKQLSVVLRCDCSPYSNQKNQKNSRKDKHCRCLTGKRRGPGSWDSTELEQVPSLPLGWD